MKKGGGIIFLKNNKVLFVFSIFILLLFSISLISASPTDDLSSLDINENAIMNASQSPMDDPLLGDDSINESSEDVQIETFIVDNANYDTYFENNNALKEEYGGQILLFEGEFTDKGVITIGRNNTKITGDNTLFINTVFNLEADGVMLTNLNFVLDEKFSSNKNAGIFITGDNCTVFNNSINYFTPEDTTAIGIYSRNNEGLKIVNNTISFYGNALKNGFNYAMVLTRSDDALVLGNNINSLLPLRTVGYSSQTIYGGVGKNTVSSFAADSCNNLTFTGNNVNSTVIGSYGGYPTLSSVVFSSCTNSLIENNNISEIDTYTKEGIDNYLYALDLYGCNDLTIVFNNIDVFTLGGKYAAGTAYPIQSSYSTDIKIAYNNLSSFSNGPNLGIYSWGGKMEIISNFINVTGLAGQHEWALVAGIEVQDTNDTILNNTIITRSVNEYMSGDNLYGISYAQYLHGSHEYNIQYNNVSTAGAFAVSIDHNSGYGTSNSKIMNNLLVTAVGDGGDDAARFGGSGTNNIIANNSNGRVPFNEMADDELPVWLNNLSHDGGYFIDLSWMNSAGKNPFSGFGNGSGSGNSLNGNGTGSGLRTDSKVNGTNSRFTRSNATHGDLNSTYYTYGDSGLSIAAASSSAGSASDSHSSVDKRAYEIEDGDNPVVKSADYFQLGIVILAVLLLLLVGYKRQKDKEEEE